MNVNIGLVINRVQIKKKHIVLLEENESNNKENMSK